MLPQVVHTILSIWCSYMYDLIHFHIAIFCGLIFTVGHWFTVVTCLYITLCIEALSFIVLFAFKNVRPRRIDVIDFCDRKSSTTSGIKELSIKWEFVRKAGGGHDAPENTLAAIKQAKKYGAAGIVTDLRLTSDGVIVLCHDESVERTTNGAKPVDDMTYQQVKELNAAAYFTPPDGVLFGHEPVPSLEDAIQLCLALDLHMFLDLKVTSHKMVLSLLELFKKYPQLYDRAVVCSFQPFVLYKIRKHDNNIMTGIRTRKNYLEWNYICPQDPSWWKWCMIIGDIVLTWSVFSWLWYLCGNSFVLLYKDTLSQQVIDYWDQRGVSVIAWTVNNQIEKNNMTTVLGIPIITDLLGSDDEPARKCSAGKVTGKQV